MADTPQKAVSLVDARKEAATVGYKSMSEADAMKRGPPVSDKELKQWEGRMEEIYAKGDGAVPKRTAPKAAMPKSAPPKGGPSATDDDMKQWKGRMDEIDAMGSGIGIKAKN